MDTLGFLQVVRGADFVPCQVNRTKSSSLFVSACPQGGARRQLLVNTYSKSLDGRAFSRARLAQLRFNFHASDNQVRVNVQSRPVHGKARPCAASTEAGPESTTKLQTKHPAGIGRIIFRRRWLRWRTTRCISQTLRAEISEDSPLVR